MGKAVEACLAGSRLPGWGPRQRVRRPLLRPSWNWLEIVGLSRLAVIVGGAVDNTGGETGAGVDVCAEVAGVVNARVRMRGPAKRARRWWLKYMVGLWRA